MRSVGRIYIYTLKESRKFGGVRGKMYFCITLSCTRQIESELSLRSLAKCLHKIGCGSAIEASFIALALHNLCITLSCTRQIESKLFLRSLAKCLQPNSVKRLKEKIMETTTLNRTQVHLLQMFQVDSSQEGLDELKALLYSYYSKKMDTCLNELCDAGILDQKKLDELNNMDLHKL